MRFDLKAVNTRNEVVALELEAADELAARAIARERGLAVIAIAARRLSLAGAQRKRFPTTLFSIELRTLLEAGLSLVEALQTLGEREKDPERSRVIAGILAALAEGEPFSRAIARFPEAFPDLYVATVRASERTGDLREALSRYVTYREEMDRVRKQLIAALLYPAILCVVGTLVVAFLTFYVVPRFARVYEDTSATLPFFSAMLLAIGRAIDAYGFAIGTALLGAAIAAAWTLAQPPARAALNERLWRVPVLGERILNYQLARFYRSAGMLLRAGIPALQSLQMVGSLLETRLREGLASAAQRIEAGQAISVALTTSGLSTPVATRLMQVGEGSGRMGEMMERVANFLDDENARFLDAFTRVFEPLLMAVLGLAVGGIVVLMYMPVFELAGSVR